MRATKATRGEADERAAFQLPMDLNPEAVLEISTSLKQLLADVFALYLKRRIFTGT